MDSKKHQKEFSHLSHKKRKLVEILMKKKGLVNFPADDKSELPLSYQQQQMWVADKIDPKDPSYNNPAAIIIKGDVNLTVLELCLNEIIRRHKILRASFHSSAGIPYQVIHKQRQLNLEIFNISNKKVEEKHQKCLELFNTEVNRPFDLSDELLIRAICVKFDTDSTYLLINFHHIISDGWSLDVFLKEFSILYECFSRGLASSLSEIDYQYTDYIKEQERLCNNNDESLNFWREKLKRPMANFTLPTKNKKIDSLTNKGEWIPKNISPIISKNIIKEAATEGVTLFIYLMASYISLLHVYTNQTDICVGTPYANRDKFETQKLLGYFVNTIVLRNNLVGDPTFKDILGRVQATAIEAYNHASVPFYKVVEMTKPKRQLNGNPLFQTMLVMNNAPINNLKIGDLDIERYEIYPSTARFDLLVQFARTSKGIRLFFNYKTQMFEKSEINHIYNDFHQILNIVSTENSNMRLSELKGKMQSNFIKQPAKFSKFK